jgi:hypothetical protein
MQAFSRSDSPLQVADAFTQNNKNTSRFKSQKKHPTKIQLIKEMLNDGLIPSSSNIRSLESQGLLQRENPLAYAQLSVVV